MSVFLFRKKGRLKLKLELERDAVAEIESNYHCKLTDEATEYLGDLVITYGENEFFTAVDIGLSQYCDVVDFFEKLGGILYNRSRIIGKFIKEWK